MSIPRLFIDTLHITLCVPDEQKNQTLELLNDASEHWQERLSNPPSRGRYRHRYLLLTPNDETITILAQPRSGIGNFLKLEYSPEKIDLEGTAALSEYLSFILGPGYRDIFYHGKVNRLDATFDLRRVSLQDLWIYDTRTTPKKSAIVRGPNLDLETLYLGYPTNRQLIVYDKKKEQKLPTTTTPWIRFEYRYNKGDYTLNNLHTRIRSPYNNFAIRRYRPIPHLMPDSLSRLLFDACVLRGAENIVTDSAPQDKALIENAIAAFPYASFWIRRNSIWAQLRSRIEELIPRSPIN